MRDSRNVYRLIQRRGRRRARSFATPAVVLTAAALVGGLVGLAPGLRWPDPGTTLAPGYDDTIAGCRAVDGDTLRCGGERVRLLGIDAPELPGHCHPGRDCAPGDPFASTASLADALAPTLRISRVGEDHYGRTLAILAGDKGDLSCWQLLHHQARYERRWDNSLRVARACPAAALL